MPVRWTGEYPYSPGKSSKDHRGPHRKDHGEFTCLRSSALGDGSNDSRRFLTINREAGPNVNQPVIMPLIRWKPEILRPEYLDEYKDRSNPERFLGGRFLYRLLDPGAICLSAHYGVVLEQSAEGCTTVRPV